MNQRTRLRNLIASLLLATVPLAWPTDALAQTQAAPESELKAAIIANMLLFVEWPDARVSALDEIIICHLDSSPVANALSQLNGKSVKGKQIKVTQVAPDRMTGCNALYLSSGDVGALTRVVSGGTANTSPMLLFGDTPGFLQRGVMVNLEQAGGRIVFDINLRSLQASGLKLSSKALRLARVVVE